MARFVSLLLLLFLCTCAIGCGSSPCEVTALNISPSSATLNHAAAPPGNQMQFRAFANNGGCLGPGAGTQAAASATWSSSDPINVPITDLQPNNYAGLATCVNPVNGPVTLTATSTSSGKTLTGKTTVTCQ